MVFAFLLEISWWYSLLQSWYIFMSCLLFSKGSSVKRHKTAQVPPSWFYNHWSVKCEIRMQTSDSFSVLMTNGSIGQRSAFLRDELAKSHILFNNLFSNLSFMESYLRSRQKILRCKDTIILSFHSTGALSHARITEFFKNTLNLYQTLICWLNWKVLLAFGYNSVIKEVVPTFPF